MKKLFFSFILILLTFLSVSACAESEIFSYPFSLENESDAWSGCFYDESVAFGEGYSAFINNPFGEVKNGAVTHVIDYTGKILLEAGKIYTLSGYVMDPLNEHNQSLSVSANLENSASTIIVTVSGADSGWDKFSTTFYAGETGEFNLSVHFTQGNVDFGFFVDELSLKETPHILSSLGIKGPSQILIPNDASIKVRYSPFLVTADGTQVSILSGSSVVSSITPVEGVNYNPADFTLTVSSDAVTKTEFTIDCALRNFADLSLYSHKITLTDNMIDNPGFENGPLLWTSTSKISYENSSDNPHISFPTNNYDNLGYFSTITYDSPQLLIEGMLYVMHARVKSDFGAPFSAIHAKNTSFTHDNTVYFNITDISGEDWIEVFAAFVPEVSGIYNISLNLFSMYDCTLYVDDIRLSSETPKPEYITLHAPGNIAVPDIKTTYPVSALLRDQLGNVIDSDNITVSLEGDASSLQFDPSSNTITVFPDTLPGQYFLTAIYNSNSAISARLPFTVSFNYVGDGTFEEKLPGEWWIASSPYGCDFYIRNDGYSKRALVNCDGEYFIMLNNSYIHLVEKTPYVFNASFSSAQDCTVTFFIESIDSAVYPLAQLYVPAGTTLEDNLTPELFLAEESVVGRLLIYVQSDNMEPFSIYADNLSLKKASILAGNLHITGNAKVNGGAQAEFSFYNSVAQNSDTSSCIVNWYVSDNPSSGFTMLDIYGKNIYFDTTFLNKYVYFEVIPVCPVTGFSGDSVRCMPFLITYEDESSAPTKRPFTLPDLSLAVKNDYFTDISSHWSKDYINVLAHSNIVSGRSEGLFAPDENITRAEFAKLISSAFSIKAYSDFSQFNDISKNDWFYSSVCALNLSGITGGTSASTFSPYNNITREDAVVMLMRVYEKFTDKTLTEDAAAFSDGEDISSYAVTSVGAANRLKIVLGNPAGEFKPCSFITRGEAAALLCRTIAALRNYS